MNISVLGAGAWGTALAISLSRFHKVTLWARDAAQIAVMHDSRRNQFYLPDIHLPDNLILSADFAQTVALAELCIIATPMSGLRGLLQEIHKVNPVHKKILWLCKGFEANTGLLAHQIVAQTLPTAYLCGALSGPSFAQEVALALPAALTLAASDESFAKYTASQLHHPRLRIYSSTDLVGVEVGGAVKNVMAIAAGICDGLGLGNNARAALISRGLAEVSRLGMRLGGQAETLMGLSGAGDLILTCTGDLSRNRRVGLMLAQGLSLDDILRQLGHVAEGVYSAREVYTLASKLSVSMPICQAIYQVLYQNVSATYAVETLLNREPNSEF